MLFSSLWDYQTSTKEATGFTPFQLVYGLEATLPIQCKIPSLKLGVELVVADCGAIGWIELEESVKILGSKRVEGLRCAIGGDVLGGVRLAPATTRDIGWWTGSRLVVRPEARRGSGIGAALVRAACAHAERLGVLRFEATIQAAHAQLFARLGWLRLGDTTVAGRPHVSVRWPVQRFAAQAAATKTALGPLLAFG